MFKQAEPQSQSGEEYTHLLLQERRRDLQSLAQRYAEHLVTPAEYQSCRESLQQAIAELIKIGRSESARKKESDRL